MDILGIIWGVQLRYQLRVIKGGGNEHLRHFTLFGTQQFGQALTSLTCIWKMSNSILGWGSHYSDKFFMGLLGPSDKSIDSICNYVTTTSFHVSSHWCILRFHNNNAQPFSTTNKTSKKEKGKPGVPKLYNMACILMARSG